MVIFLIIETKLFQLVMTTRNTLGIAFLFLITAHANSAFSQKNPDKEEWIKLFNGKNLKGWDIKIAGFDMGDNYKNTFRIEKGVLKVAYDQYDSFHEEYGHLYYKTPYSYYKLVAEYRFTGEQLKGGDTWNNRNSGIMIHSQSAASNSKNQLYPVSLEVQLLGGLSDGKDRPTGNVCTPGTFIEHDGKVSHDHIVNSKSKTYDGDQWVKVEVIVLGDSLITHLINGEIVLKYSNTKIGQGYVSNGMNWKAGHIENEAEWIKKDGTHLSNGYIALQAESHAVEFKKVELLNLEGCMNPKCSNYKSYYIKSSNTCNCTNLK